MQGITFARLLARAAGKMNRYIAKILCTVCNVEFESGGNCIWGF